MLQGVSLGTGSVAGEERMPAVAFHNWKCFVLRKFPDEKLPENRSRLYVYGPTLEKLQEYGPPTGQNWRYPFFVKVFDPYVMIAYYSQEHYEWAVYKVGGPVLLTVWTYSLPPNFVSRQISGSIFDQEGLVVSFLLDKKRETHVCIAYLPFDDGLVKKKKKTGPHYQWKYVIRRLDFQCTDPSKVRVWSGANGVVLALVSPFGTGPGTFKPEMCLLNFSRRGGAGVGMAGDRFILRKSLPPGAALNSSLSSSSSASSPSFSGGPAKQQFLGTEALRKELLLISDDLSVDELMLLVKQAKEIKTKKTGK